MPWLEFLLFTLSIGKFDGGLLTKYGRDLRSGICPRVGVGLTKPRKAHREEIRKNKIDNII